MFASSIELARTLRRLWRDRAGAAAVEFALVSPIFLALLIGVLEFGSFLHQASNLEKSLRSGAMYGARSALTTSDNLTCTTQTEMSNIIKYGNKTGTGDLVVGGWADTGASSLTIGIAPESGTGLNLQVISVSAVVPYDPVVIGLVEVLGFGQMLMRYNHQQVYIGGGG